MDSRVYILPIVTALIFIFLFFNSRFTGIITGKPENFRISANVSITISQDGFIPYNSYVVVYLDGEKRLMSIDKFIKSTGEKYDYRKGRLEEINYTGFGYAGPHTYSLDLSMFGFDNVVSSGEHNLTVEVMYKNFVISHYTEKIVI